MRGYSIVEIEISKKYEGKTLHQVIPRSKYKVNIIAVKGKRRLLGDVNHLEDTINIVPQDSDELHDKDAITIAGADSDLARLLEDIGGLGIGKVTFQRREHLCCLRPLEDVIILHSLRYETEILTRKEISPPKSKLTAAELDMAVSLVKAMAKPFMPEEYRDEYREALKKMVEAKSKGIKITAPATPRVEMGDLMASLRASIEAAKKEPALKK